MNELLWKVQSLIEAACPKGVEPGVIYFTKEDEQTLVVDQWMKHAQSSEMKYLGGKCTPPSVRQFQRFAGMRIEWDAPATSVRPLSTQEKEARGAQPLALFGEKKQSNFLG